MLGIFDVWSRRMLLSECGSRMDANWSLEEDLCKEGSCTC